MAAMCCGQMNKPWQACVVVKLDGQIVVAVKDTVCEKYVHSSKQQRWIVLDCTEEWLLGTNSVNGMHLSFLHPAMHHLNDVNNH